MMFSVIVAARLGSTRLPGKALLPLGGKSMLGFLLHRLRASSQIKEVVFATTTKPEDDALAALGNEYGVPVFRGEEDDVVARFAGAGQLFDVDHIVRVTGDCPFVDGELLDWCLSQTCALDSFDIATTKRNFPIGLDVEIFSQAELARQHAQEPLDASQREHLTKYFYDNPDRYVVRKLSPPESWPKTDAVFTVDEPDDYAFAKALLEQAGTENPSITQLLEAANEVVLCGREQ